MNKRSVACGLAALVAVLHALLGLPARAEQPIVQQSSRLELDVESVSPRIISGEEPTMTVVGRITNTGDRPITDIRSRLQVGNRLSTAEEVSRALTGEVTADAQLSPFELVIDELAPGESFPLRIEVGLRGGPGGFVLTEPGLYPLLININGQPAYGGPARLVAISMLLPVLDPSGSEPPAGRATPMSFLWPIAGPPTVVSSPLDGTLVTANDSLAEAMRTGGRLDALVSAAESARGNPKLFSSLCFAIDPELLTAAEGMVKGYRVRTPAGTVEGGGSKAAQRWLGDLRTLVKGQCVIALPYAGADVTALGNLSPELTRAAIANDGLITRILGVEPRPTAFWLPGALTDEVVAALAAAKKSVVLTDPTRVASDKLIDRPVDLRDGAGELSGQQVVPTDRLLSMAFGGATPSSEVGYVSKTAARVPTLATQDGIAALAFRTRFDETASGAPLIVAPPRRWDARADELAGMLRALTEFTAAKMITPTPMGELLDKPTTGSAHSAAGGSMTARLPTPVASGIADIETTLDDVRESTEVDPAKQVKPQDMLRPIEYGLLRAASTTFRTSPATAVRAVSDARTQLTDLLSNVQVTEPGRTISLASGAAPLPVSVTNGLPVAITVRIRLFNTVGLRPEPVPDLTVPAARSVDRQIPAEALRAGVFNVDVGLSTPGGTDLGTPVRFKLASTQYGLITVIVTATAAGALLLLSGRRIFRRVRASRADRG